ncbi:MAG TPA: hypothetical protein VLK33_17895 [Terriglobales bacterium]|nr:hypothetical protein [Terriglobales bacterium]
MNRLLQPACNFMPPKAKAIPVTDTLHGHQITDPYRWLQDADSPRLSNSSPNRTLTPGKCFESAPASITP